MSGPFAVRNRPRKWLNNLFEFLPIHAILIAAYVWLSLYATNYDELPFDNVLVSGVATITTAIFLVSLIWVVLGNGRAAGVISTLIIVCVAYYGQVFDGLDKFLGGSLSNKIFMPTWAGVFLLLIALSFIQRSHLRNLTKVLNVSSVVLFLMPLGSLALSSLSEGRSSRIGEVPEILDLTSLPNVTSNESDYPDIYYLVFDRYADNRTLNNVYMYDNSELLDHLRGLGFYIADQSRANYTKTAHSLASSLNLTHLTHLAESIGTGSSNWKPLYTLLQNNFVVRFLKARGYRYIHLGSWWEPTRRSSLADENYEITEMFSRLGISMNEFEKTLIEPMFPIRLANRVFARQSGTYKDQRTMQFSRVQLKFEKLAALRRNGAPTFIFAHMLVPHDPFVFFDDGRYKTRAQANSLTREENYIDQLIYANQKIKGLVDQLLKKKPQPIIIIQADEGPFPSRPLADSKNFDWRLATEEELRQKFRILNAIYFPNREYGDLYKDITPVNTFRVIFNRSFGLDLPLLSDASYSHYSGSDLYSFFEVTEAVK